MDLKFEPHHRKRSFNKCVGTIHSLIKAFPVHLTLILQNPEMPCLCKQRRSRFWRSQLIWICAVCHVVCEFMSTDWLKIWKGHEILIYSAGQWLKKHWIYCRIYWYAKKGPCKIVWHRWLVWIFTVRITLRDPFSHGTTDLYISLFNRYI